MRASRRRRRDASRTSDAVRLDSYPHPYPTGWYRLADSAALGVGDVQYLECLGRQLVLWRSEDEKPHVMHAFCPHLGANLSFGRVRGACIECPFHRWRFTGDGRAAHVPYSDYIPDGVLTETFPVQEVHGQLFVYHACDGTTQSASDAPPYFLPDIAEVDSGAFVFRGSHDAGRVRMHIVEFAENAVDMAHFQPVHSQMHIPWTQVRIPGFTLQHETRWELDPQVPWKMYLLDDTALCIFGRRLEGAGGSARVSFYGPASLARFRIVVGDRGAIELCQSLLPVGPLEQQVDFRWYADRGLPRWLVWYVVGNWISQWAQDIEIWENKVYQARPRLCRDDGPVFRLRQWYRQFLPDERTDVTTAPSAAAAHIEHGKRTTVASLPSESENRTPRRHQH